MNMQYNSNKNDNSNVGNFRIARHDDVLLAYIDLLGTKNFYSSGSMPILAQAERMFNAVVMIFVEEMQNRFKEEVKEHFYVNIYADSIMIAPRKDMPGVLERLIEFLLAYQRKLVFVSPDESPVPSRILMSKGPYFSISGEFEGHSILGSKYTSISLCGGRGMVELDEKLKGLPVGVYISKSLLNQSKRFRNNVIKVRDEDIYFIKQDDYPNMILPNFINKGNTLRDVIANTLQGGLGNPDASEKWTQWISAHESGLSQIVRTKSIIQ